MKRGAIEHPKTLRLARLLELERWGAVGILESLWHFTAKHAIQGDIGKWQNWEIAAGVDWKGDPDLLVRSLLEAGFFDTDPQYRLLIHDWKDHCDQSVRKTIDNRHISFAEPSLGAFPETFHPAGGNFPPAAGYGNGSGSGSGTGKAQANTTLPVSGKLPEKRKKPSSDSCEGLDNLSLRWNAIPGVHQCAKATAKRKSNYRERAKDPWWLEHLDEAIRRVAASGFCRGGGDQGWVADIDWFLRPDTVTRLIEGKYDDRPTDGLSTKDKANMRAINQWLGAERGDHDATGS